MTLKSLLFAIFETSAPKENFLAESISKIDLFNFNVGVDISLSVSFSIKKSSLSSSIFIDMNKSLN